MGAFQKLGRAGIAGAFEKLIVAWALTGGVVLLAVVAINIYSTLGNIWAAPFPGDFELTEIGVAIAVFSFLPFCQITDANVTADIFTSKAGPRLKAFLALIASVIAFGFGLLLLWRMYHGMSDQKEYDYTTAILQIPVWYAYVPVLISLLLLSIGAVITLSENTRDLARRT
ncbi:TRAP transporter small permease [Pseudovibrio sp. Ad26]|uniref:TRAP transporter small permease n=1 Tax=Pseudovibrio sp. Ad26 TaxID=989410 RepID=UPI0007AE74A8|nr:TRAP transporter small permease [Pseudovibrio sp. Ad26]KZL13438.1 Tripartite ATP-independent periplasmic transporter, DctQ component [Pseudovibrio sp. Ad26]